MIASFSHLSSAEFDVLTPELTLFLFPVGGLEQHGPHLPLGTKLFQAESETLALAQKVQALLPSWSLIIMPLLPLSVDSVTSSLALTVRPHVVRDALVDQCENLKRLGFSQFAAFSAHVTPKQLAAIEDAGRIVGRKKWALFGTRAQFISISSAKVQSGAVWSSPMIAVPLEHGGALDTGWILKLNPKLVSPDYLKLPDVEKPKTGIQHFLAYFKKEVSGYWGKPSQASAENAQTEMLRDVDSLAYKLQPVLEQGQGQSFFQSGYRYFPLNGSFFKAYLFALIFFVLMLIWVMWSLKDVFNA